MSIEALKPISRAQVWWIHLHYLSDLIEILSETSERNKTLLHYTCRNSIQSFQTFRTFITTTKTMNEFVFVFGGQDRKTFLLSVPFSFDFLVTCIRKSTRKALTSRKKNRTEKFLHVNNIKTSKNIQSFLFLSWLTSNSPIQHFWLSIPRRFARKFTSTAKKCFFVTMNFLLAERRKIL